MFKIRLTSAPLYVERTTFGRSATSSAQEISLSNFSPDDAGKSVRDSLKTCAPSTELVSNEDGLTMSTAASRSGVIRVGTATWTPLNSYISIVTRSIETPEVKDSK